MGRVSRTDKVPTQSLCAGIMTLLVGLLATMPGSKAFGTAGCGGNPFVFLPAQLWFLLDERGRLFLTTAFQYAVQELPVANPKHELVEPLFLPLGQASSALQSSCSPVLWRGDPWLLCALLLVSMTMAASKWHILLLHRHLCPGSGRGWAMPVTVLGWGSELLPALLWGAGTLCRPITCCCFESWQETNF